jgi:hypothetical protein
MILTHDELSSVLNNLINKLFSIFKSVLWTPNPHRDTYDLTLTNSSSNKQTHNIHFFPLFLLSFFLPSFLSLFSLHSPKYKSNSRNLFSLLSSSSIFSFWFYLNHYSNTTNHQPSTVSISTSQLHFDFSFLSRLFSFHAFLNKKST